METSFIFSPKNPLAVLHDKERVPCSTPAVAGSECLQSAFQCVGWGGPELLGKTPIQQKSQAKHNLISMADIKYAKNSLKTVSVYLWWAGIPARMRNLSREDVG